MVVVAAIARFSSGPSQSYVFSIFIDPVIAYTGLSRTAISSVYTVGTLVGAGVIMVVSRLADRLGARVMLAVVAFVLGAVCCGLVVATPVAVIVDPLRDVARGGSRAAAAHQHPAHRPVVLAPPGAGRRPGRFRRHRLERLPAAPGPGAQ